MYAKKNYAFAPHYNLKTTDYWILPRLKRKKNTELNIRMYKNARYWKNNWLLNLLIPESRYVHEKKKLNLVVNEIMRLLEYWLLNPDFSKKRKTWWNYWLLNLRMYKVDSTENYWLSVGEHIHIVSLVISCKL